MSTPLTDIVIAGAGFETALQAAPSADVQSANPFDPNPGVRTSPKYFWPYAGAAITRHNWDFLPPHRSGSAAVRMSWDRITRRVRWLLQNNAYIKRLTDLMVQYVVGDGISSYSAAIDHLPISDFGPDLLNHRLFEFGDESDSAFEWWADRYADVGRKKTLFEMQTDSARDLFGPGNTLWLQCAKKTTDKLPTPTVCYQVLEAEQLDKTKDRPASADGKINRVSNGIEYDRSGEPIACWLYDAHPYDDGFGGPFPPMGKSQRVPWSRIIHLALTSRPSQEFGSPLANLAMDPARDLDCGIGHELTAMAIAASLTLLLKQNKESGELSMDGSDPASLDPNYAGYGLPHIQEAGFTSGGVAQCMTDESVEVVESKTRPNTKMVEFGEFLINQMCMAYGTSFHRMMGNPKGASFASLRAMIGDDRAMSRPLTRMVGFRLGHRVRAQHDTELAALGGYRSVEVSEYLANVRIYQDYEVQGPPPQHLTQVEDVKASRMRIESGQSTLREECALLNKNYRRVLRQLALEKSLAGALGLVLNFGSGGGGQLDKTSTDAGAGNAAAAAG